MSAGGQTTTTQPPKMFLDVKAKASAQWDALERDPDLAGPWRQLFDQVKDPRHVLSELLQNADDAGATDVLVQLDDSTFLFSHNGEDFAADHLASLCRFGFSNKRLLHTIGFRGIGFKSIFSLGDRVEVLTPSLTFAFDAKRFTDPIWIDGEEFTKRVTFRVALKNATARGAIDASIKRWSKSPASLLFFRHVRQITLGDTVVHRTHVGEGPIDESELVKVGSKETTPAWVFRSPAEVLPDECLKEIREVRQLTDEEATLPPCQVEVVFGIKGDERLYTVLPTDVTWPVPFSCNAPFILDPARTKIRDPAISPTNRWLLDRVGRFVAEIIAEWTANDALAMEERVKAYWLLPAPETGDKALGEQAAEIVVDGMKEGLDQYNFLITTSGEMGGTDDTIAVPHDIHKVWDGPTLGTLFGGEGEHVLNGAVTDTTQRLLRQYGYIRSVSADDILERLKREPYPPRPAGHVALAALWTIVSQRLRQNFPYQADARQKAAQAIAIVPAIGLNELQPAEPVVRLPARTPSISEEDWAFLCDHAVTMDADFLTHIESLRASKAKAEKDAGDQLFALLDDMGLERASDLGSLFESIGIAFFGESVEIEDAVRLSLMLALLDIDVPDSWRYICRDKCLHEVSEQIVASEIANEELFPDEWLESHLLSSCYLDSIPSEHRQTWIDWLANADSGVVQMPFPSPANRRLYSRLDVADFCRKRGVDPPQSYHYARGDYSVKDFDFDEELWGHWKTIAKTDANVWAKIVEGLLVFAEESLRPCARVTLKESGTKYSQSLSTNRAIPAAWLWRLRQRPCVLDEYGRPCQPAEVLRHTSETQALVGVERFINPSFETAESAWLLDLLGVHSEASGADKLLDRIRALMEAEKPPISELRKWYDALDRVLSRATPERLTEIAETFSTEPLILDQQNEKRCSGELYLRNALDLPELPVVHPELANLHLWTRLDIAVEPDAEALIDWLKGIELDSSLPRSDVSRVRAILSREAVRVWTETGAWLSWNGSWKAVDAFEWAAHADDKRLQPALFESVREKIADFSMLAEEIVGQPPFDDLQHVAAEYSLDVSRIVEAGAAEQPPSWLRGFALAVSRIKHSEGEQTSRLQNLGTQLQKTLMVSVSRIEATPYLGEEPAGQVQTQRSLWSDDRLYLPVASAAQLHKATVEALAPHLAWRDLIEALNACIGRDREFVDEYMAENFELEESLFEPESDAPTAGGVAPDAPAPGAGTDEADEDETDSEATGDDDADETEDPDAADETDDDADEPDKEPRYREIKERGPDRYERFAISRGFHWSSDDQRFNNEQTGEYLIRERERTFPLQLHTASGDLKQQFWFTDGSLDKGLPLPVEVWELIKGSGARSAIVLPTSNDSQFFVLTGDVLQQMIATGKVKLFASSYRLRSAQDGSQ